MLSESFYSSHPDLKHKTLIILRAGDGSLHENWLTPSEYRNFDLAISYFGDKENPYAHLCVLYENAKDTKFPSLYKFISNHIDFILQYDAVWLPDDDLYTDAKGIYNMFDIFYSKNLWLAQPALTPDSYYSHDITLQRQGHLLRYTNFVEVMAPIFSKEALLRCLYSFSQSRSGWGLDFIWSKILDNPTSKIAVIDAAPVRHTRPLGSGAAYQGLNIDPSLEMFDILNKHGVNFPYDMKTHSVCLL
ncbi:MAG: DUF707 domain-containing protein [Clostridia bacterium]|nr:DUF707 domain-containing protein [Clostridia bacterium]